MIKILKMKKLSILILTICSIISFGQKVSDYKYVSIPGKFSDFKEDFGLANSVTKSLKAKKYIIIPQGQKELWPIEAKENPCNVLTGNLLDDSGFLRNKVLLQFKDCNDKVILQSKGSSIIKEFEEGFQDALKQALVAVPVSNPIAIVAQNETTTSTNNNNSVVSSQVVESNGGKYSNGKLDVQKVQIDNNHFILVKPNSSIPFATFKATTKRDVFRVKLENGDLTIGYFENGNIIIEIPQANGEYAKEIFSGK